MSSPKAGDRSWASAACLCAALTLVGCDFRGSHVRYEPRIADHYVTGVEEIPPPEGLVAAAAERRLGGPAGPPTGAVEGPPGEPASPPPGLAPQDLLAWSIVHGGSLRLPGRRVAGLEVALEGTWALVQDPALPPGCSTADLGCFGWIMQRQGDRYVVASSGLVSGLAAPTGMPADLLSSFEGAPLGAPGLAAASDPETVAARGFQGPDDASAIRQAVESVSRTGGRSVLSNPQDAPADIVDGWALVYNPRLPPFCEPWTVGASESHRGGCFAYLFRKRGEGWHLVGSGSPEQLARRPGLPPELGASAGPLIGDD